MTEEEYIDWYCKRYRTTREILADSLTGPIPCYCHADDCPGWRMASPHQDWADRKMATEIQLPHEMFGKPVVIVERFDDGSMQFIVTSDKSDPGD